VYDITLQQIYFFIGVAEHKAFSGAARSLRYSQPAISRGITRLEEGLGFQLFLRTQDGVELTERGKYLYSMWRPIVDKLRKSMDEVQNVAPAKDHILTIQCCDAPAVIKTVKSAIKEYKEKFPDIQVTLELYEHRELLRRILLGNIDLAFAYTLPIPDFPIPQNSVPFPYWRTNRITAMVIKSLGSYVFMSASNPLAANEPKSLADFKDETFILPAHFGIEDEAVVRLASLLPVEEPYGPIAECKRVGFYPKRIKYVPNTATLLSEIRDNNGVTIFGNILGNALPEDLKLMELTDVLESHYIITAWKTSMLTEPEKAFMDMLPRID